MRWVVALVALLCVGCGPSTSDGIDDIETTLSSIEADLDQP